MSRYGVKMSSDDFAQLLLKWTAGQIRDQDDKDDYADSLQELNNKSIYRSLETALRYILYNSATIRKDLSKVEFDFENYSCNPDDGYENDKFVLGFWATSEDIPVLGCLAGGDWENPIYFVLYPATDKSIRAYIPSDGNTWVVIDGQKTAWGNGEDQDPDDLAAPVLDVEKFKADVSNRIKLKNVEG